MEKPYFPRLAGKERFAPERHHWKIGPQVLLFEVDDLSIWHITKNRGAVDSRKRVRRDVDLEAYAFSRLLEYN
jgi:hypothetical protein